MAAVIYNGEKEIGALCYKPYRPKVVGRVIGYVFREYEKPNSGFEPPKIYSAWMYQVRWTDGTETFEEHVNNFTALIKEAEATLKAHRKARVDLLKSEYLRSRSALSND